MNVGGLLEKPWFWPVVGGGVILLIVAMVLIETQDPFSPEPVTYSLSDLPSSGDAGLLQQVQTFESQGNRHVDTGTPITYDQVPPTSGTHYGRPIAAGFYTSEQPYGGLVHSLEHGAVVAYYADDLPSSARSDLERLAEGYQNPWGSVIAVPQPESFGAPIVLTAWRAQLALPSYDEAVVRSFLAEYLGRGPENPVR